MFEVLEHAADIGFRARAGNLRELFARAAEALVAMAMEVDQIEPHEVYPIEAEADSIDSLLVNWLSEVLYYIDGRQLAFRTFNVKECGLNRVSGEALGEPRHQGRHPARLVIKGVTYHQLKIEQSGQEWYCEVFVDI
jgi:SHS2 domain-containing protein